MFNIIRRRRHQRRREIYAFFDGSRQRSIDPMRAYRALLAHPQFNWETHPVEIDGLDSDVPMMREAASEASDITLGAVRDVFGVTAWDDRTETGLTETETIAVLIDFVAYLSGVKKNINGSLTSPPPSEDLPSASPSATTKHRSDCSSTSEGRESAKPTSSRQERSTPCQGVD